MNEELRKELEKLQLNIEGKSKDMIKKELKALLDEAGVALIESTEEEFKRVKEFSEQLEKDLKEANENIVKLDARLEEVKRNEIEEKSFMGSWSDMITENKDSILSSGGQSEVKMKLETKAPMTLGANLTGTAVQTYQPNDAENPSQALNFRQLVPAIQSATGIYVIYREGAVTGAPADQVEGAAKSEVTFQWTEVPVTAAYLAGRTDFSRQMATDLPFLSTGLPRKLIREYYKAENSKFYTALSTAATASTEVITGKNIVEMIMNDMAKLEEADWMPNGILTTPTVWYDILKTEKSTGAGYGVPGLVIAQNGAISINGVPVRRASWVAADKYLIGDWNEASRLTVAGEGLNVRFFEQNKDNVDKNLITARVEERNALVVERPDAFIFGDVTNT